MEAGIQAINERVRSESGFVQDLMAGVGKVIVGQRAMVERILIGLLTGGHVLLEGVPGLAKTLAVRTLAQLIQARFSRIQFTPDLLPADVTGTMIYHPREGTFSPKFGPIFANLVLADEINRAPAKVQSALLEAMQEHQVTIGDRSYPLEDPFLVLATQNPIEQEGTYPLPEAQVDRFMLKLKVTYPSPEEERAILERMTGPPLKPLAPIVGPADILRAREAAASVYVDDKIKEYVIQIVFATREPERFGLDIRDMVAYGASPRATIYLTQAAKAHAFLRGRGYVTPEDIKAVALDVLRHRVIITYEAEAEEVTAEEIARRVLDRVEVP